MCMLCEADDLDEGLADGRVERKLEGSGAEGKSPGAQEAGGACASAAPSETHRESQIT